MRLVAWLMLQLGKLLSILSRALAMHALRETDRLVKAHPHNRKYQTLHANARRAVGSARTSQAAANIELDRLRD